MPWMTKIKDKNDLSFKKPQKLRLTENENP